MKIVEKETVNTHRRFTQCPAKFVNSIFTARPNSKKFYSIVLIYCLIHFCCWFFSCVHLMWGIWCLCVFFLRPRKKERKRRKWKKNKPVKRFLDFPIETNNLLRQLVPVCVPFAIRPFVGHLSVTQANWHFFFRAIVWVCGYLWGLLSIGKFFHRRLLLLAALLFVSVVIFSTEVISHCVHVHNNFYLPIHIASIIFHRIGFLLLLFCQSNNHLICDVCVC